MERGQTATLLPSPSPAGKKEKNGPYLQALSLRPPGPTGTYLKTEYGNRYPLNPPQNKYHECAETYDVEDSLRSLRLQGSERHAYPDAM